LATGSKSSKVLVSSKIKKGMTIADLEESGEKGSVWVLNTMTGDMQGQLLINVPKKHGNGQDLVRVPKTFIPMDLTDQVSKGQLVESSEFRKTITGGLLKLITPEYAELVLSSDEGREERRRVVNEMNKAKTIMANAGVASDEDDEVDVEDAGREARKLRDGSDSGKKGTSKANVKLQTAVNNGIEAEENEKQVLARIKNHAVGNDLTISDVKWLHTKLGDKPRIKKYLKEVYDELKKAEV
jgi:hypothetical protein